MAIYASHARGTQRADLATLGAISAPLPSLAADQLFTAHGARPAKGPGRPAKAQLGPSDVQDSAGHRSARPT